MLNAALAISSTMVVRGIGAVGGVLLSLAIARLSGADGLGRFAVFLSLLGACAILARHGMDMLLTRAVAWASDRTENGTPVAYLRHCAVRVLIPALVLGGVASAVLASGALGGAFPGTVALTPVALPLLTVLALVAGYAKGRSRPWLAPLFEIGGISILAALLLVGVTQSGVAVHEGFVTIAFVVALSMLVLGAGLMICRDMPRGLRLPVLDADQRAELHAGQVDFTLIALATFLTQAGSFLLAAPFLSEADLGLLRAAERFALLVSFPVMAINPVMAPRFVQLSRGSDTVGLRRLTLRAVMASSGIAACVLLPLFIWPELALASMGPGFTEAVPYLRIMALAQFLAALIGPLAMLLNMSDRERVSMWINVGSLGLALVVFPVLSYHLQAYGFVIAYVSLIAIRSFLIASTVVFVQRTKSVLTKD